MQAILIVEDNPPHMALAAMLPGKSGYAVFSAGDAEWGYASPANGIPVIAQTSLISGRHEREISATDIPAIVNPQSGMGEVWTVMRASGVPGGLSWTLYN